MGCMLLNIVSIAPSAKAAAVYAPGRRGLASGGCSGPGQPRRRFLGSQRSCQWQRSNHMVFSGPWRLESPNPKVIYPLSGAHIWNAPSLAGSSL